MDDMPFTKGQKVIYTDSDGTTHPGVVEVHRMGWVLVELSNPLDTRQGWNATRMMLKQSRLTLEGGGDHGDG